MGGSGQDLPFERLLTQHALRAQFLESDGEVLLDELQQGTSSRFSRLNAAVASIVTDHNLVSFVALDLRDEDSIALTLAHIDSTTQWGEDAEPKDPGDAGLDAGVEEN